MHPPKPTDPVRLSVIVASYNRASFLPDCVASLRNAGVPGLEIVIVDDGSRDNTRSVVESLGPGISYIYQENRGLSAARNTGILAAQGQYLAYLDSDDYWLPGVAPRLLDFLDRQPDVGAVFTEAKVGNPQDGYTSWIRAAGQQAFLDLPAAEVEKDFRVLETLPFYRGMLQRNAVFTGAIIQRRELVIEAGLFEPELKATGDWELWLRMIHRTRFAYCPETLAIYTRHDDNMTNDHDRMRQAFCDTLRVHDGRGFPLADAERNLLRKARKDQAFDYAYRAYDRGDYAVARRRFGSALSEHGLETRTAVYWGAFRLARPVAPLDPEHEAEFDTVMRQPDYSIIIPTYKRPDVLALCLEHLAALDHPLDQVEVLVFDNGGKDHSGAVVEQFRERLPVTYVVNEGVHGMGYSLNRGLRACRGSKIVEMNDDALVPPHFLTACDAVFAGDRRIGCVGFRALEDGYASAGDGIGRIDDSGEVIGNFDREHDGLLEVEHVYGFCYAYTREALRRGGVHDEVLIARDYSSGNRLETDHCLTLRRLRFKVVYESRIAVRHLAKPRGDFNEKSLAWKRNHVRNTLYLFLKHYGPFGKKCLALRFTFLHDVGIISACRKPSWSNLRYFLAGLRGRISAFGHYLLYLCTPRAAAISTQSEHFSAVEPVLNQGAER